MSNCEGIVAELGTRCRDVHVHQALGGGRATLAIAYPAPLCDAIVRGLIKQMQDNVEMLKCLLTLNAKDDVWKEDGAIKYGKGGRGGNGWGHEEDWTGVAEEGAWDDLTGEILDKK